MKQNIIEHVQIMQEKTEKFILNHGHDKNLIASKFYENLIDMKEEFITMNKLSSWIFLIALEMVWMDNE